MAAQRLFPLVDAKDRLKARRGRFRTRLAVVQGKGVERLYVETALVGQVKDPAPFDSRKRLNLFQEGCPVRLAQPVQLRGGPAEDLRELENHESPLFGTRQPPRTQAAPEFRPQRPQGAGEAEHFSGQVRQRQPVQQKPDRQELDQAVFRNGADRPIAALLEEANHAGPAPQRQERGGEEVVPLGFVYPEGVERLPDGLQRVDVPVLEAAQFGGQSAQPAVRRPERPAVQRAEGAVEPLVPPGELPASQSLVQERTAEADQYVVNQQIGVDPRHLQEQVPVARRQEGRQHEVRHAGDAIAAYPPQRLERERLPLVLAPLFDPRLAEALQEPAQVGPFPLRPRGTGKRAARFGAAAEVAHHPAPRLRDHPTADSRRDVVPNPPQRVLFSDEPEQFLGRPEGDRVLEHGQAQLQPGAEPQDVLLGPHPQVLPEDRFEVGEADSPALQLFAVAAARQVWLAAEHGRAALHCLGERQVL
jgi:hypothetical protein